MFNFATCQISPLISSDCFCYGFQRHWKEPFAQKKKGYELGSLGSKQILHVIFSGLRQCTEAVGFQIHVF